MKGEKVLCGYVVWPQSMLFSSVVDPGASRIRIRLKFVPVRIRILPSTKEKRKKNLDFYFFATSFWLFIYEN
jgi:hypothetical protein